MNPVPLILASLLALVLFGIAGYFGWQQIALLRRLRAAADMAIDELQYQRRQAWRRLICCAFMALLGALLGGSFLLGQEKRAGDLAATIQEKKENQEPANLTEEQRRFRTTYAVYWIVTLLVLMAILFIAGLDLWAIRSYALRHHRQIQADRRAMIESEIAAYRTQRNGHR